MRKINKGIYLITYSKTYRGMGYWSYLNSDSRYDAILIYDEQNFPLKMKELDFYDIVKLQPKVKLILKKKDFI